jgi:4-amino-4-deoxy-L-arabinose transferase-like glycosyltransferase
MFRNLRPIHVVAVAIAVRVAAFLAFQPVFDFVQTGRIHGSEAYDTYARNLLTTGVFGRTPGLPDSVIPPAYAFSLSALYSALGRGELQVAAFHLLLDVLTILLVIDLGRRLFPQGRLVGLLAGLAVAFYPYLIFQSLTVIDTPLFTTLLTACAWLIAVLRQRRRIDAGTLGLAVAAGLVFGFAILTRPVAVAFALLVPAWFLFRLNWKETVLRLLPVALVGVGLIGSWTARNYRVYRVFLPVTATAGSNFWQGNSSLVIPLLRAGYDVQWTAPDSVATEDRHSPQADAELFHLALDSLDQNRAEIPELLWVKFLTQWSIDLAPRYNPTDAPGEVIPIPGSVEGFQIPRLTHDDPITAYSEPLFNVVGRWVHRLYWGTLLLLAVFSTPLLIRSWREVSLIWFVELAMTLAYVVFHPATRYRAPGDPLLFLLSAYTLVWLARRLKRIEDDPSADPAGPAAPLKIQGQGSA